METVGRHLLAEFHGCAPEVLDDEQRLGALLESAARRAGATVVRTLLHRFSPQGVTGVVVLEESHLSIHTWPEHGYAAVDFFTCGDCEPGRATPLLTEGLGADRTEVLQVERGLGPAGNSLAVREHRVEHRTRSPGWPQQPEATGASEGRIGDSR